jgi:hypothetical protein
MIALVAVIPVVCVSGVGADSGVFDVPVVWEHYIEPPVSGDETVLAELEVQAQVSLPQDLRDLIITRAGQVTEPGSISLDGPRTTPFAPILYAGGKSSHSRYTYSIEFVMSHLVGWAEAESPAALGLFPFASNTGTGYFCVDFRSDPKSTNIVFVDLNFDFSEPGAIRLAAPDLATLLAKLK